MWLPPYVLSAAHLALEVISFTAAFLQNNKRRRRARGQEVVSDFILKSEKISESFQQMKATHKSASEHAPE